MRRRHLESVSAAPYGRCFCIVRIQQQLSVRGSWGTAPSVFWYGVPGGAQGPLGKGGAAERWRVAYPIGIATRHGAKPATTHTSKRNAPAASRTGFAPCKINAPPLGDHNLGLIFLLPTFLHRKVGPRRRAVLTKPCTRLRPAEGEMKLWHNLCHQSLRHGCAVPPPFTQGRLWCCAKLQTVQYTERCIEVRSLSVQQIVICRVTSLYI